MQAQILHNAGGAKLSNGWDEESGSGYFILLPRFNAKKEDHQDEEPVNNKTTYAQVAIRGCGERNIDNRPAWMTEKEASE